jgi:AraC-like DNA-binding protein
VLVIKNIPKNTPPSDSIFLAASYNQWKPNDSDFLFTRAENGQWYLQLDNIPGNFKYKITRGHWKKVETDTRGQHLENREVNGEDSIFLNIDSWDDVPLIPTKGWLELYVREMPENTPPDASIYVTGSFNGWNTQEDTYRLTYTDAGNWFVKIPLWSDTTLYKFTRGSWETVEGKPNGQARVNRVFVLSQQSISPQYMEIESWEDLSGNPISIYTLILLLAGIQGVLLILAINTLQNNNLAANRFLSILIFVLSVALIGKVSTYDRDIFNRFPHLLLLPDVLFFLYGPLFFLYIQRLLHLPYDSGKYGRRQWLHFIPFLIQLLVYLPLLLTPHQAFIDQVVDRAYKPFFAWAGGLAFAFNLIYWFACQRYINAYIKTSDNTRSSNSNLEFLRVVMWLQMACLAIWLVAYCIGAADFFLPAQDISWYTDTTIDTAWIVLSLTVFFLGFYSMRQPEIFKLPIEEEEEDEREGNNSSDSEEAGLQAEELLALKSTVETLMSEEKPYRNPGLALNELAERAGTNRHSLSRVINEGFNMNFNDFVNSYRIEEFKSLALDENYKNHTLLAIAHIVGFNSKSAFNRSFKKLEQCTPREYLKRESSNSE